MRNEGVTVQTDAASMRDCHLRAEAMGVRLQDRALLLVGLQIPRLCSSRITQFHVRYNGDAPLDRRRLFAEHLHSLTGCCRAVEPNNEAKRRPDLDGIDQTS